MKKIYFLLVTVFGALCVQAQTTTTINFDNASNWTASAGGSLSSYQVNHVYIDGLFSATSSMDALRQGTATQDGFPGANGTYSWRLRNSGLGDWLAVISSGGVSTFSVAIRRWDASPNPNYTLDYSVDGGATWTNVASINNTTLSNSSAYTVFNGTINSTNSNIFIRVNRVGGERIMIDDFVWTDFSSTFPVRYSKINVFKSGLSTVLDWQTVTEDNCKSFNILHSTDGLNFEQIGTLGTKAEFGNSTSKLDYRFVDHEARTGINYYRLEQVDINNNTKLSEIFDIVWGSDGSALSIYPNPATSNLTIDLTASRVAQAEIKLVDMTGRIVKTLVFQTVKGANQNVIDLSGLTAGVYGVQVFENNELTQLGKFRKN